MKRTVTKVYGVMTERDMTAHFDEERPGRAQCMWHLAELSRAGAIKIKATDVADSCFVNIAIQRGLIPSNSDSVINLIDASNEIQRATHIPSKSRDSPK